MRTDDGFLVSKCLEGDSAAFGILVDKYKAGIYALAYSRLHNFHDAEDVAQDAFIEAYKKLPTLRRWDSFSGWLYSITNNLCKNFVRSKTSRPDNNYIEDQDPLLMESHSSESYQIERISGFLHDSLNSLPEMYQKVLSLHYLGGLNSDEIANVVGVPAATVRQRLSRGRDLLKKEILDSATSTFESKKLKADFTFEIVEAVKRINITPKPSGLPWGLSFVTMIAFVIIGSFPFVSLTRLDFISKGFIKQDKVKIIKSEESQIPIVILNSFNMSTPSGMKNFAQVRWTKHQGGPVLYPDQPDTILSSPMVMRDNGVYKMWYRINKPDSINGICYATSKDGINWDTHSIVLEPEGELPDGWESQSIDKPFILKENGVYKMWYTGNKPRTCSIGYATSDDGIHWTKYSGNPVLSSGLVVGIDFYVGTVIHDGDVYKMWYTWSSWKEYGSNIGYATSPDGINWKDHGKVLKNGVIHEWDASGVSNPYIILQNGTYTMWFNGFSSSRMITGVGCAVSSDGINWVKAPNNPVFYNNSITDQYSNMSAPSIVIEGTTCKMWYAGFSDDKGRTSIGYATADINGKPSTLSQTLKSYNERIYNQFYADDQFDGTSVFGDDFSDGVIDPANWVWSPNGVGGDIKEEDGVLKFILRNPAPYKQVRNSVNLYAEQMRLSFRINPVYIKPDSNLGIYIGEMPDDPTKLNGFAWTFHSIYKMYSIKRVKGAHRNIDGILGQDEYAIISAAPATINSWHDIGIRKMGNIYRFYFDSKFVTAYEDPDPASLSKNIYWTGGISWNFPCINETGELWFDDIKAEVGSENQNAIP